MPDQDYNLESPAQLIPPPQSSAASGMGLAPAPPQAPQAAPSPQVAPTAAPAPAERVTPPLAPSNAAAMPPFDSAAGQAYREQNGGGGDPLNTVVSRIYKGETGGDKDPYHRLYGSGGHFGFPQWEGRQGPAGMTHAAGAGQWQPGTWERAAKDWMATNPGAAAPDFNKPQDQDKLTKFWAAKIYKQNTGRDLASDAAAGKVNYGALAGEWSGLGAGMRETWNSNLPPELRESLDYSRAARGKLDTLETEFLRRSQQSVPGSADRHQEMDRLRTDIHHATEEWMALTKRPPVEKPVDMWQNFGSPATIVAMLGGLFARHHLSASLNAAGLAMQAINTNNHQQFKQQWDTWKTETEYGLKLIDLKQREIDDILKDDKLAWDRKMAEMKTITDLAGMTEHSAALARSDLTTFAALNNSLTRGASAAAKGAEDLDLVQRYQMAVQSKRDAFYADPANAGKTPTADDELRWKNEAITTLPKLGSAAALNPRNQAAQAFASEIETKEGRKPTAAEWSKYFQDTKGSQTGKLEPETVQFLAKQYEMGDPGVITSLPRGGSARIDVENQVAKDLRGMDDAAKLIVMNRLRMAEARSAATTAGRITMQTDLYATEAIGAGRMVVDTSKSFPRTSFPTVNAALEAYERHTGDPNVIQFGVALNALFNVYGKMSNPTGTGIHDADKERLSKQLDIALSQGQIEAGVDQIIKEGQNVASSAVQAQKQVLESLAPSAPAGAGTPTPPQQTAPHAPAPGTVQDGYRFKGGNPNDPNAWEPVH